jgi:hypothetical protein
MQTGQITFILIPLLIYTYLWVNPLILATFLEGLGKYLVEVYLGFKDWKIEYETQRAYRRYMKASQKLAENDGFPSHIVRLYFKTYGKDDWKAIRQQNREIHEDRYRDFEDTMREMLLF